MLRISGGKHRNRRLEPPEDLSVRPTAERARLAIFNRLARQTTGNFFIDDEVLTAEGVTDFNQYAVSPGAPLIPDFFVPAAGARTVVGRS